MASLHPSSSACMCAIIWLEGFGPFPASGLFAFGHAGVDFFFVLSGFIILHVHAGDIGRPVRLGHYLQRRFTRVYPFYWVVFLLALLAMGLRHASAAQCQT